MSTPKRNQSTVNAAAGIGVVVVALFIGKALFKIGKRVPVEDVAKSVTKLDGGADNVLHATPQTGEKPTSIVREVVMETGEIVIEGTLESQKENAEMEWEILRRALKLPQEQQEAFIVQACGEDTCLLEVTLERLNRVRALRAEDFSPFTRAERLIVILYHYEHMTFKEIGLTLDLPEEEIDQMHESILRRMAS